MTISSVKTTFLVHEVVVLTGFSKYMLDYLAREDIFRPSGQQDLVRGRVRRYTFEDVVLLRALKKICAGKGQIRHFARSLKNYRRTFGPLPPTAVLDEFLVVQGNKLCTYDENGLIELLGGQRALTFFLDLSVVNHEVRRNLVIVGAEEVALSRAARLQADTEREKIWAPIRRRREGRKGKIRA